MAQNYTRQSSFTDGDTITASLYNNEYNQIVNTFSYSSTDVNATGHRHDGTSGEGGNIYRIGDLNFLNKIEADSVNNRWGFFVEAGGTSVEQIRLQDGAILPVTNNDVDLGSASLKFKNVYSSGTLTATTVDINGGAIDGTTVGSTSASSGAFTTLSASGALTGTTASFSGDLAVDTDTLFVDVSADRVGIGTSSPQEKLHLVGGGIVQAEVESTTASGAYFKTTNTAGSFVSGINNVGNFLIYDSIADTSRITVATTGNVGIGTSSPASALDVNGTVTADGLSVTGSASITASSNANLQISSTGGNGYQLRTDLNHAYIYQVNRSAPIVQFSYSGSVSFYEDTGTTPKMVWDASEENLLLGTTVYEKGYLSIDADISYPNATNSSADAFNNTNKQHIKLVSNNNSLNIGVNSTLNARTAWLQAGHASPSFADTVNTSELALQPLGGNVGIGTSSPTSKLQVTAGGVDAISADVSSTTSTLRFGSTIVGQGNFRTEYDRTTGKAQTFIGPKGAENFVYAIDSLGNFGLGEGTPAASFHIAKPAPSIRIEDSNDSVGANSTGKIEFTTSTGTPQVTIEKVASSTDFLINNNVNGDFVYSGNSVERFRIEGDTGRVGVNTGSPAYSLHVNGSSALFGIGSADDPDTEVRIRKRFDGVAKLSFDVSTAGSPVPCYISSDGNENLTFAYNDALVTTSYLNIVSNGSEVARFTAAGSLGIGTSSPAEKLHVAGNAVIQNVADTSIYVRSGNTTGTAGIQFGDSDAAFRGKIEYDNSTETLSLASNGYTPADLVIASNGNVGIGTSSPSSKLHLTGASTALTVEGTARADLFLIDSGAPADQKRKTIRSLDGSTIFGTENDAINDFFEAMRIDASGRVGINTTAPTSTAKAHIVADNSSAQSALFLEAGPDLASRCLSLQQDQGTSTVPLYMKLINYVSGTANLAQFWINSAPSPTGSITTNGSSVSYNTSSDYRLKENVVAITDAVNRVKALNVYRFNFIGHQETVDGFLAHEVQQVVPESVVGEKDAVDSEGNPSYQAIDQSKLVPLLTKALQDALTKIEALESRIAALEAN